MTTDQILAKVAAGTITIEEAGKLLAEIKPTVSTKPSMKVGEKGGVSFKNLVGTHFKFGLTLYPKTLEALFAMKDEITAFMEKHRSELSWEKAPKADDATEKKAA